jgi:tRNA (guanosine-2'-O-)-methyltransferase
MGDQLVELDEVRVAQRRDRAELALEPDRGVALGHAAKFQRDLHVEAQIVTEVHHAHAAAAELADQQIAVPDDMAGCTFVHRSHGIVWPVADAISRIIERFGPEAVCTTLAPMLTAERIERIDSVLAARLGSVVTVVEDTYDPRNAAATIRTTEAIGLHELHVIEPSERFSASGGVTRGAHKWIDLQRWPSADTAVAALHARGFRVYATLPGATHTIDDVDVTTPLAIVFGNEHDGLTPAAIAACDGALGVPMFGFTESFNLSVTVALAMSRIAARRRAAIGAAGDLEPRVQAELRARWFALKIRGAIGILGRALGN